MASRRSRSPSTPSEGEIIESGSETKATTSQLPLNGTSVDRQTRADRHANGGPGRGLGRVRDRDPALAHPIETTEGRNVGARMTFTRVVIETNHLDAEVPGITMTDIIIETLLPMYALDLITIMTETIITVVVSDTRMTMIDVGISHLGHEADHPTGKYENPNMSERGNPPVVAQDSRQDAEVRKNQVLQFPSHPSSRVEDSATGPSVQESQDTADEPAEALDEAARLEARRKRREAIKAKYRGQATPLRLQAHIGADTESSTPTPSLDAMRSSNAASVSPQRSASEAPNDSAGDSFPEFGNDADIANHDAPTDGADKDEPSAADYDPTIDMKAERQKHDAGDSNGDMSSARYDETQTAKQDVLMPDAPQAQQSEVKAKDPYDMFAEDDDDMFAEDKEETTQPTHASAVPVPQPQELDISMMDNWDDPEGYYNVRLGELINGRYHVQQNLGKGMFSSVVRATDAKTGGLVAIKIIRQNDTMKKAGLKEIGILEQLREADPEDKKHVIRFERHFDHKGHLCMVFENLSMNLREVLKKFGRDVGLNLRAIRAYAQQIFLGLSLLRKCNILHADLKPDNLLVNEQRNVLKVCDLGSASPATENEITPYLVSRFYRAPEIILGIPYDHAIDVWSIGCTLFELYTGKILFTGRNNNQMLRSIMECRGKYPPKLLRKGTLTHQHFDDMLNFHSTEEDKITGRLVTKVLDFKKPTRDLRTRLMGKNAKGMTDGEAKELALFVDLLDRCLSLNPEKRCTPAEALRHPFIARPKA
ncbi:serine/threonine-protein kinase prp4 [Aspergillus lentulus]|uniref:non-specific serine/threonine protein kinase n=1 Tax=Aspergillus lentulus TaxID=293939 RepID=A0AAN4PDQ4_ASPLE|nr:serine/threonine-protein kinase prp4 [Aspergillus lentulus]